MSSRNLRNLSQIRQTPTVAQYQREQSSIQRRSVLLRRLAQLQARPVRLTTQSQPQREMSQPASGFKRQLWIQQQGQCFYCEGPLLPRYHVDHIHPKSKGGPNHVDNYCLACQPCNHAKRDRPAVDFLTSLLQHGIV